MNVQLSEAVWNDLATLYGAGEASPETRALVEARARENPAFAGRLREAATAPPALPQPSPDDAALRTLRRTREYIRLRTIFLAGAIAFTLLPLSFAGGSDGIRFLILHEPALRNSFWSIAAASWVAWWLMHRQVRRAGL